MLRFILVVALSLLAIPQATAGSGSAAAVNSKSSPVTFDIPTRMKTDPRTSKNFKAVSSHGRDDSETGSVQYSTLQVALRATYLLMVFAPMFATSGLAYISSLYRDLVWFSLLRFGISQGGAAFIKWAQWASTRPDIFPEELCNILASLQSGAPAHSLSFTKQQIQKELGAPTEKIFEYFSSRPIASGSIAQVYKARLNGQDVAVKVRHPNVEEQIGIDFIIMKSVAGMIDMIPGLEWLKLSETMSQFSSTIASQTKLDVEGRHLFLFNHYFRRWKGITFPKPIVLTESILIETFEYGESVAKYVENLSSTKKNDGDVNESIKRSDLAHFIVTTGEDTYLKMLLQDNLMHADLHPGNILIQHPGNMDDASVGEVVLPRGGGHIGVAEASSIPTTPTSIAHPRRRSKSKRTQSVPNRIVLVDAGMVARLVPTEQRNFIGLVEAIGEGKGAEAADHVMRFTAKPMYNKQTRINFRRDMKDLFDNVCKGYGHNVNLGETLRGILHLVRLNKITIDANYATLVMNALCLDSLAASLSPTYNIIDGAKPLLRFHRVCKRIPGARFILKAVIPIARWLKRQSDRIFLFQLQKKIKAG